MTRHGISAKSIAEQADEAVDDMLSFRRLAASAIGKLVPFGADTRAPVALRDPHPQAPSGPLIPPHGGCRKLKSFQVAQLV